jgi:hypothetical protein
MVPVLANGWLELGNDAGQGGHDEGTMAFDARITNNVHFSGQANWTQLVLRHVSYPRIGRSQYGLDTTEFYNPNDARVEPRGRNPVPTATVGFSDSPGVESSSTWNIIINDSFETYLMFKPDGIANDGIGNIWVTLGVVTWGWGASEKNGQLMAPQTVQPTYQDTDQFPTWTQVYSGHGQ